MQEIILKLKELSGREFVRLTDRGNTAIDISLEFAKNIGRKKVLIPDQGGWIHYKKAPPKFNFELKEIKTNYGLIDLGDLEKNADKDSVLLACSMPGYFVIDDIEKIYDICLKKCCLLINDISGSIGREEAKIGDIILCSFGKAKPVDLGYGGFIATNNQEFFSKLKESNFDNEKYKELFEKSETATRNLIALARSKRAVSECAQEHAPRFSAAVLDKLENLPKKLENFQKTRKKILNDLKDFEIIYPDRGGINVIVKFDSEERKQEIIDYCNKNALEYTLCPGYIRVNEKAVSIEIKRL